MRKFIVIAALVSLGDAAPAYADLGIFACEPEWGALSGEIGGEHVSVYIATTGAQDPHQIQARPSLIAKAASADVTVCTGAELEIGWLPKVVSQSSNGKIAPGTSGSFEAALYVNLVEAPSALDRAQGDIHPQGNPHIQTDARNILVVAKPLADRFSELDPANAAYYASRYQDFAARWSAALARWEAQAAPLRGVSVVVQHRTWPYLLNWLGMKAIAELEPKPGVPPSSGHLAEVVSKLQTTPARMVIHSAYEDGRPSEFISEQANIPAVTLPYTVGGTPEAKDLFSLYDDTVNRLLGALK